SDLRKLSTPRSTTAYRWYDPCFSNQRFQKLVFCFQANFVPVSTAPNPEYCPFHDPVPRYCTMLWDPHHGPHIIHHLNRAYLFSNVRFLPYVLKIELYPPFH